MPRPEHALNVPLFGAAAPKDWGGRQKKEKCRKEDERGGGFVCLFCLKCNRLLQLRLSSLYVDKVNFRKFNKKKFDHTILIMTYNLLLNISLVQNFRTNMYDIH